MEQAEIETLVGELETRIDRLRALYDQYFMGIERLEPLVPRKDVERRMAVLRKEQIRNTGLRFKFNVIIQRFNTYQTYWLRIARQIEQGTYRRDVMRATARFGVDPTKERVEVAKKADEQEPEEATRPRHAAHVLSEEDELGADDLLASLEVEASSPDPPRPPEVAAATKPRERFASAVRLELDDLADPFEEHDPFPKPPPPAPSIAPKIRIALRPGAGASQAPSSPEGEAHGSTDRRLPAGSMPAPRIAVRPAGQPQVTGAPPPLGARGAEPRVVIAKRASVTDELERAVTGPAKIMTAVPGMPPPPQRQPTLTDAAPPPGRLPPTAPRVVTPAPPPPPAQTPGAAVAPAPRPAPGVPLRQPAVGPSSLKPAVTAPPVAPPKPPAPSPPAANAPRAPGPPPPMARPATPAVVKPVAPPPPPPAPKPAPPPPASPRVGDLSDDRFGQIYSKYVETRRERNEPTHAITREALAKQLSESTERLKQKHGPKAVDFEVVVKDGKTILRPVVK